MTTIWRNWAGNQSAAVHDITYAQTEAEIIEIVQAACAQQQTVRVAGTGHSWAPLISGADRILSLQHYNKVIEHDKSKYTITVQAGMRMHDVAVFVHQLGWQLPTMAFLDVQVMGAILSTTTHGCGHAQPILAELISACRMIDGQGNVVDLKQGDEDFSAVKTGLGLLGIASTITIRCEPATGVVSDNKVLCDHEWMESFNRLNIGCDFFDVFWFPHTGKACVMSPRKTQERIHQKAVTNTRVWDRFGALGVSILQRLGTKLPLLIPYLNRLGIVFGFRDQTIRGPLHQVLALGTDVEHRLYNCEYSFPIETGLEVLKAIKAQTDAKELLLPALFDVRTVKSDNNYLSQAYGHDVMTIGCSIDSEARSVPAVLYKVEALFKAHSGRPHLAKVHTADHAYMRECYPGLETFTRLAERYDPQGIFRTQALRELLWDE